MRKVLLLVVVLVCAFSGNVLGQVFADFETTVQDFYDNGWGTGFTSVAWMADPTGMSAGVMALECNAANGTKGVIQKDNLETKDAPVIGFHVYLPADFPDDGQISIWGQDNANWAGWNATEISGANIPKETWFPVYFNMKQISLRDPDTFYPFGDNKLGKIGLQVFFGTSTTWAGTVYVDNGAYIGVEPKVFSDFETNDNGFYDNGWGTGFTAVQWMADPSAESAGVLALDCDAAVGEKGVIQKDNVDPEGAPMIAFYVWLPADFPDEAQLEIWGQDNANWAGWNATAIMGVNIPKETWFPIYFNMEQISVRDPATFNPFGDNKLGKLGIQVYYGSNTTWSGTVYVDNGSCLGMETGAKWILADFENVAAGVQGFTLAGWGPAGISIERIADPTGQSDGVLQLNHDYNAGTKSFFSKESIQLYSNETMANVSTITIDVYIPADFPESSFFETVMNGPATIPEWTWTPTAYDSSTLVWGEWNTLSIDVQALIDSGMVDPQKPAVVGVQTFDNDPQTWSGNLYFDNLTLNGIPEPEGALASPPLVISMDTTSVPGGSGMVHYVRFDWVDNTLGTETYNIYMSTSPFTSIEEQGVIKYAGGIPHGFQSYAHRPYTSDGSEMTYYYAITATDGITETDYTTESSGSITLPTTPNWKILYVEDFSSSFVLDGLNTEFLPYVDEYQITPETGAYADGSAWEPGGSDLDFKVTMIMDDEYLYYSGDVTDDDLREVDGGFQAWQGDALELYMGFYNILDLDELHQKGDNIGAGGDWRISFTSMGDVQLSGYISSEVPGLESVVFAKFTGDGYIVEAKYNLDSLAGGDFQVTNGMLMPFKIDNTDMDPVLGGDEERTLMCGVGSVAEAGDIDLDSPWRRPHCWGVLEVIGGPTSVQNKIVSTPREFRVYDNYPNPFNPATTIQYDIPKNALVQVKVFDILGREVATLVNKKQAAGTYSINFDASNLANGIYIYKITADNYSSVKKMMLLK